MIAHRANPHMKSKCKQINVSDFCSAIVAKKRPLTIMESSCSENETSPKKFDPEMLSPQEKEQRLQSTMRIQPDFDAMDVQDALVRNKWDVSMALKFLKTNCQKRRRIEDSRTPTSSSNGSSSHHRSHSSHHHSSSHRSSSSRHSSHSSHSSSHNHHHKSKSSHRHISSNDRESDDEDSKQQKAKVFDSDEDSDSEVSKQMSRDRKTVFEYLNNSSVHELQSIKSCSLKKAQLLVDLRPFRSWEDLVSKMRQNKFLSSDLLNNCQELLARRKNLSLIMKKCTKLIDKLETAVAEGKGLISQPATLSPK